jgi:hypothetical protein
LKKLSKLTYTQIIILTGLATFFFGFGAGALLNWYFIATNNPFVQQFRSTLTYSSAIIGDGLLLPITNMLMVAFLLRRKRYLAKRIRVFGVLGGLIITAYFHITQALEGIVNWAMPSPWHWNALGVWHFFYMLSVTTLISTFYITSFVVMRAEKRIPRVVFLVSVGIFIFLVLLRVDYINVKIF